MRVLSVATLFTPDGAFGGPTRVALNQAAALRQHGHTVVVAGGARGYGSDLPREIDGQRVHLFPAHRVIPGIGFAGLAAPGLLRWLRGAAREADVVHIHAARDLITLPAAEIVRRAGVPYVLQTHGMIDPSPRRSAALLDGLATRRLLTEADALLYLTALERDDLVAVAGRDGLPFAELVNGVPASGAATPPPQPPEVLFLARLHPRKRPDVFVRMALALHERHPQARFALVGPDEGVGELVTSLIGDSDFVRWEGALPPEQTLDRIRRCSVFVLPAVDEPFGMSALEAMSVGRPVVVTDSCGLGPLIESAGAGRVVGPSLEDLVEAVDALLSDPAAAAACGAAALDASAGRYSMDAVAESLEAIYQGCRSRVAATTLDR